MPARERPADRGRRLARAELRTAIDDLRLARTVAGLSQATLADATRIARTTIGRIERGEVVAPGLDDLGAMASALGLRLRVGLYPDGEPIHDRVQLRLMEAFRARLHPGLAWRTEVPLPIDGDRRAWDAVAIAANGWTGVEGISKVGAVDGLLRRSNQKLRDDGRVSSVVLVIADTVRNRAALRLAVGAIRPDYPLDTRTVLGCLAAGRLPPLNGIVLLRVPPDRP